MYRLKFVIANVHPASYRLSVCCGCRIERRLILYTVRTAPCAYVAGSGHAWTDVDQASHRLRTAAAVESNDDSSPSHHATAPVNALWTCARS